MKVKKLIIALCISVMTLGTLMSVKNQINANIGYSLVQYFGGSGAANAAGGAGGAYLGSRAGSYVFGALGSFGGPVGGFVGAVAGAY
jgi:hypothetical protein